MHLSLHFGGVGPGGVHESILVVFFHLLVLLLLPVVIGEHGLVGVTIDDWLPLRGTRTARLQLHDELRFLVVPKVVAEDFARLQLLRDNPKRHFGNVQQVLVVVFIL